MKPIKSEKQYNKACNRLELLTNDCADEAYEDEIGDILTKIGEFEKLHPELVPEVMPLEEVEKLFFECVSNYKLLQQFNPVYGNPHIAKQPAINRLKHKQSI